MPPGDGSHRSLRLLGTTRVPVVGRKRQISGGSHPRAVPNSRPHLISISAWEILSAAAAAVVPQWPAAVFPMRAGELGTRRRTSCRIPQRARVRDEHGEAAAGRARPPPKLPCWIPARRAR
jgi:hypothetical protein